MPELRHGSREMSHLRFRAPRHARIPGQDPQGAVAGRVEAPSYPPIGGAELALGFRGLRDVAHGGRSAGRSSGRNHSFKHDPDCSSQTRAGTGLDAAFAQLRAVAPKLTRFPAAELTCVISKSAFMTPAGRVQAA